MVQNFHVFADFQQNVKVFSINFGLYAILEYFHKKKVPHGQMLVVH